ncbi:hypothetical protein J5N97_029108 [Dioscorea zingiberensis]|uniref:RNase H type-1 domain-containing protein n=1 Tax=Dioscorea zingiberensis TaxID=325984 RepID=A0A9D5C081_9LILI|nr:hypothetical protein J5N97_029108 [Dioscorea zingiberensis]
MELSNAISISLDTPLFTKDKAYSMDAASQGNVIGPPHGKPNSSSDILKSSLKILLSRYAKGTMNRFPSKVYTLKWPFSATDDDVLHELKSEQASALGDEIFLLKPATFCHVFAISVMSMGIKAWCNKIFKGKVFDPHNISNTSIAMAREFFYQQPSIEESGEETIRNQIIKEQDYKIYSDASWNEQGKEAGIAYLILSKQETFCFAGIRVCEAANPFDGELKAMLDGLNRLVKEQGRSSVLFTDNIQLARLFK